MVFDAVLTKESQIGAAFVILLASSSAGVIVSALRGLIDGIVLCKKTTRLNYGSLTDSSVREAFNDAIRNTYRFVQACGNMCLSILIFLVLKYFLVGKGFCANSEAQPVLLFLGIITVIVLCISYLLGLPKSHDILVTILNEPKKGVTNELKKET